MIPKKPFEKLKDLRAQALECSEAVLTHVKLTSETSKLNKSYQLLGQKLYGAICDDLLKNIKDDPSVVEIIGEIEERLRSIKLLHETLKNKG